MMLWFNTRKAIALFALMLTSVTANLYAQDYGGQSAGGGFQTPSSSRRSGRQPRGTLADRIQSLRQTTPVQPAAPAVPTVGSLRPALTQPATQAAPAVQAQPAGVGLPPATAAAPPASPAENGFSSRRSSRMPRQELAAPAAPQTGSRILHTVAPQLEVHAVGPPSVVIGKAASYMVTVQNTGKQEAGDIVVSVALPKTLQIGAITTTSGAAKHQADNNNGQTHVLWQIERVPAGGSQQLSMVLTPQENRPFKLSVDWAFRPASASGEVQVLQPRLEMSLVGPRELPYGVTKNYTVVVSNPGTGPVENVTLNLAPVGLGQGPADVRKVGMIPAGQQREFKIELSARQAGVLKIRATSTADGGLEAEVNEDVTVRRAKLEMAVIGPRLTYAPSETSYKVQIANMGDAPATNMMLAVVLPNGAKYLGGIDGGKAIDGGVAAAIGDLAPGERRAFSIQCALIVEGRSQVQAQARADGDLIQTAVAITQVETIADLKLSVNDPKGPMPIGDNVTYEIKVKNRGAKAARGVQVIAQFAEGVEPVSTEGGRAQIAPGQVLFQPVAVLEPNEEIVVKVVARGNTPGNHIFRAEVKSQDPNTRQVAEGTTKFFGEAEFSVGGAKGATVGAQPIGIQPIFPR